MAGTEIVIHRDDIIKEGFLVKQSKHMKEWRRRWFVLTPQYLCSFKSQGEYRNPTEHIRLAECSTVKSADEDTGKENSFRVDTPARVFYLIADSSSDKESWIGHIGRQMVRPAVPRQILAAQLSLRIWTAHVRCMQDFTVAFVCSGLLL
ncbi:PH1 [Symbiodinium sp. CCMP2592]|nr:PH1 [Symbiodinium sp. CCMP2592]